MAGGSAGERIDGRFELVERLGSGGMGTVWRAHDMMLRRDVALKEVRPPDPAMTPEDSAESRRLRERVLREARALARIDHPGVVTIHHVVDAGPHPWLVMELVRGENLQDRLARGPLPPTEAARIGREVLAALRAAHAVGIHHRDVKPANVLLRTDGSAVLTDFGIAAHQGSTSLTATGELVGSPEYIAPERIRGVADGPPADLWSLGMTLYVAVEGHSPLRRGTSLATLAAVLDEPVPPPTRSGPLKPVLDALLVRDPDARPDAAALDGMLAAVVEGRPLPGGAPPLPPPPPHSPHAAAVAHSPTELAAPRPGPAGDAPTQTAVAPTRRRGRAAVVAAVVVGVLALAGGVGAGVLLARGDTKNQGGSVSPTPDRSPTDQESPTGDPTPDDGDGPDPTGGGTPGEETGTHDDRPGDKGDGNQTEDPPSRTDDPGGDSPGGPGPGWIAQLFSEPVSTGAAARDRRLAAVRASVPEARMLRSDDYASLNPGYWVFYAPGPFTDGRAAVRWCADRGRTTANECVGRYLSDRAADKELVCHPQGGGSGRCTRP
ncbi:serine/threonine protein kinase [Streptomyces sp. OF3]|uniref:non-specific serine/threonine protein kinase n=1 Tax=Streptomyces alkaliterrae TaxID=2213162 RepID=A0A7W3WJ09_9ACTN|nr:serine/threonine-protein kinase [Streptomyces alkaliterrae]MBB1253248.1 serine/threonine protein kinase [Streptomyces alkaliterrae]